MNFEERLAFLIEWGQRLQQSDERLEAWMSRTAFNNEWFTLENQKAALNNIVEYFLSASNLKNWLEKYDLSIEEPKGVLGLILAGNIPLVGFHDILCGFISGHQLKIKCSDKDPYVLPYILEVAKKLNPKVEEYFTVVDKLKGFDKVIATGSNNSARYFESYFTDYPHIIRRNRNAVALLDGKESEEDLELLAEDVFAYFGLGCRNVSKLYVPKGYSFNYLLEIFHRQNSIVLNTKYKNNFDYNFAMLSINRQAYLNNGCILLIEDPSLQSRIATLHFEYYEGQEDLKSKLIDKKEEIQCVVTNLDLHVNGVSFFPFGQAQTPALWDYADGVDTLAFLLA